MTEWKLERQTRRDDRPTYVTSNKRDIADALSNSLREAVEDLSTSNDMAECNKALAQLYELWHTATIFWGFNPDGIRNNAHTEAELFGPMLSIGSKGATVAHLTKVGER